MLRPEDIKLEDLVVHTLSNGCTVMGISDHGFQFSDGTRVGAQNRQVVDSITLTRQFALIKHVGPMAVNEVKMILTDEQQRILQKLETFADIIIVPFPVLVALKQQNIRHLFPKCVAFNATPDTARNQPSEKIVDINNWSW